MNGILSKHGTSLLTGIGIISCGVAVIETYKATENIKAKFAEVEKDIEYACKYEQAEPPTKPQKVVMQVKKVAPVAAPPVIWFTFGSICIISAQRANNKKITALTTAYELSETARREYMKTVRDKLGDKKAKEIDDDYYHEQAQKNMPAGPSDRNICVTGHGDQLYFDEGSGRFFRASPQWLEKCKVDISHDIFVNNWASVNDFYYILGIPDIEFGNGYGWNSSHDLDSDDLIYMRWDLRAGTSDWGETYGFLSYEAKTRFKI